MVIVAVERKQCNIDIASPSSRFFSFFISRRVLLFGKKPIFILYIQKEKRKKRNSRICSNYIFRIKIFFDNLFPFSIPCILPKGLKFVFRSYFTYHSHRLNFSLNAVEVNMKKKREYVAIFGRKVMKGEGGEEEKEEDDRDENRFDIG